MTTITPSGEALQAAGLLRTIVKAAVLEIAAAASLPPGTRLSGTVAATADGRLQIRSGESVITIAADAGLEVGMPVAVTLLRSGDDLVARIQQTAPSARPPTANAGATVPQTAPAPPAAPAANPTTAPQAHPRLPAVPPPRALPASAVLSIATAAPEPSPSIPPPADPAATPMSASGRTAPPIAVAAPERARAAPLTGPAADMPASADRPTSRPEPGFVPADPAAARPVAKHFSGGPDIARADGNRAVVPSPAPPTALAALPARGASAGAPPLPPVHPSTLLELLRTMTEDQTAAPATPAATPTGPMANSPRLDLDRFTQSLAGLVEAHPSLARSLLTSALPAPDRHLGKVLFAFVTALGRGDASLWLGPELRDGVAAASPAVADHLAAMLDDRTQPATAAHAGWREADIPLLTPTGMLPMRVMVEEKPDDQRTGQSEAVADAPSRLIVECTLSHFARIQLDTLVRKPNRCDIIVRSAIPLPRDVQAMVLQAFGAIGNQTGMGGGVSFQSAPAGFVDPAPLPPAGTGVHLSA